MYWMNTDMHRMIPRQAMKTIGTKKRLYKDAEMKKVELSEDQVTPESLTNRWKDREEAMLYQHLFVMMHFEIS